MRVRMLMWSALLLPTLPAMALPKAEIERPIGTAQAKNALHTVRQIPEACTRIEGHFTGNPQAPYAMQLVRTSPQCQPRAEFQDADRAMPSEAAGWKLNEVVRIPSADCAGQLALIEVWRRPVAQTVTLDGQGKLRVYLEDSRNQAAAGKLAALPAFSARLTMQGKPCE